MSSPNLMRKHLLLLLVTLTGFTAKALAQASDDNDRPPPEPVENLWFDTDELIYVPKYTLSTSMRALSGTSASFSGTGHIASPNVWVGPPTGYTSRGYQDGYVKVDGRTDSAGVPVNSADGKSNTWSYDYASQATIPTYIALHTYTADTLDSGGRTKDMGNSTGVEVAVSRDMGKLYKKITWSISAGVSMNDIRAAESTQVAATINTTTDLYSLYGMAAPAAGYVGPATTSQTVTGPNGQVVYSDPPTNSTPLTQLVDNTVLISAQPITRSYSSSVSDAAVTNHWEVKGAYLTFRAGSTFYYPITDKFRFSLGVGGALAYVGSTYSIDQLFTPNAADNKFDVIESLVQGTTAKATMGFYVDANLEYWMTDKTGFFAGATYQDSGSYTQHVQTVDTNYATRVDLSSLSGLSMGMNYKF